MKEEDKFLYRESIDSLRGLPLMVKMLTRVVRDKSQSGDVTSFVDDIDKRLDNHVEVFCKVLDRFNETLVNPLIKCSKRKTDEDFWK